MTDKNKLATVLKFIAKEDKKKVNDVMGYSLFNEIENKDLQSKNRAVVLANIIEDNMHETTGAVTGACLAITGEYFKAIDTKDARQVYIFLQDEVMKRKLIQGGI